MLFANRMAAFVWGFAVLWMTMLMLFTWLLIKDGPPGGYSHGLFWALVGLFWLGGAGLTRFALSKACYSVAVKPGGTAVFAWQYPHKRIEQEFPVRQILKPDVVEEKDSDGDPYFFARLKLPNGDKFDLAEGHDRRSCELTCETFEQAIKPWC